MSSLGWCVVIAGDSEEARLRGSGIEAPGIGEVVLEREAAKACALGGVSFVEVEEVDVNVCVNEGVRVREGGRRKATLRNLSMGDGWDKM